MPKFTQLAFAIGLILTFVVPVRSEVTPEQVRNSIRRGVQFLKDKQDPTTGGWPEPPGRLETATRPER